MKIFLLAFAAALTGCAAPATLTLDNTTQESSMPKAKATAATAPAEKPTVTETPEGCTIQKFTIHSPSMKREIEVAVMLPPAYATDKKARFPVLYTLHGMDAPYATYTEMGPLRAALKDQPILVVAFNGDKRGWFIDATKKPDSQFTTFFFDELIPYIDGNFRSKTDGQSRGVTGFSMGGYGAFHYMLSHPDRIGSVSSLSGAFDFPHDNVENRRIKTLIPLLGPYAENKDAYQKDALYPRLDKYIQDGTPIPPMFIHCGTEDTIAIEGRGLNAYLIEQNRKLHEQKKPGMTFTYKESPGIHNWIFWRDASEEVIEFHWRCFEQKPQAATQPATRPAAK